MQDTNYSKRMCECGRNHLFKQYNATVDGKQVCSECLLDSLYKKAGVEF